MLYVSGYDKSTDRYTVTDTDDGVQETATSAELFEYLHTLDIRIYGVNLNGYVIQVVRPVIDNKTGKMKFIREPVKKTVQTRQQYLDENVGYDYIMETREARDFTEFVLSTGGDTQTMRVYGSDGDYSIRSK